MTWLVFSYSLPAQQRSSPRVTLWRRLRRLGAISLTGGVHILPAREECLEAFQWLTQEIQQAQGEALVMRVEQFEGLSDQQLIEHFCQARREEYGELETQALALEQAIQSSPEVEARAEFQDTLDKLHRRHADIARVDYFDCPAGRRLATHLVAIQQALSPGEPATPPIASVAIADYRERRWVTRPRPHVDRLACVWLIRRFINPAASIRYATQPEPDEVAFDMREAQFSHQGSLCTFETMLRAFGLIEPGLPRLAEIVHEIDLRDGRYVHPEVSGVDAILKGWLLAGLADTELEAHGIALFEGLYTALADTSSVREKA